MAIQDKGKFFTVIDQWQVDPTDNLDVKSIKDRFLNLPEKMTEAVNVLEPYFRVWLLSQTIQMVIGGLKPATSISIDRSLIVEYKRAGLIKEFDFSHMHKVLYEKFGLRVTEKLDGFDPDKLDYFIYNPELLQKVTAKFDRLMPYDGGDINVWIKDCQLLDQSDYINGFLYGYPVSAIKQFTKYQTNLNCRLDGRKIINTFGEAYVVWGNEEKRDVMIHERVKEAFFTHLANQDSYMNLVRTLQVLAQDYRRVSQYSFEKMISYSQNYYKL